MYSDTCCCTNITAAHVHTPLCTYCFTSDWVTAHVASAVVYALHVLSVREAEKVVKVYSNQWMHVQYVVFRHHFTQENYQLCTTALFYVWSPSIFYCLMSIFCTWLSISKTLSCPACQAAGTSKHLSWAPAVLVTVLILSWSKLSLPIRVCVYTQCTVVPIYYIEVLYRYAIYMMRYCIHTCTGVSCMFCILLIHDLLLFPWWSWDAAYVCDHSYL